MPDGPSAPLLPFRPVPLSTADDDPYAIVPTFYDAEHAPLEADGAFFARHGETGPLLILGCGTGRICRLLETDRPVTGLDRSTPMLDFARRRAKDLDPRGAPQDLPRVGSGGTRYVLGDMTGFDVGSFAEVIVPNATFAFLRSRRERADCLTAIHRALLPEGVLWIDMPMPDFSLIGTPHSPERDSWQGEVEDRLVRRTRETFRRPEEGLLLLVDRFYSGQEQLAESRLQLHIALPEELEWAIESCGFYVDGRYGGYSDQPLAPGVPRVLIRAVRA